MRALLAGLCLLACAGSQAVAESCPGNPDAIGTSRTITVDPATLPLIGTIQYHATVPLNDHEVVLTFDDGPVPAYSERILETLKENCVKATYFLVGSMARAYPWMVRRIYNDGHTIGTHSNNHPFGFARLAMPRLESEVEGGIASVQAAAGDAAAVSPFFRIPGLSRSTEVENYLGSKSLAVWSADEVADDWRGISADEIVRRAMRRIEEKDHRGVLLLHDIHPATALALPKLLKELKDGGYHIVQVIAPGERPKTVPELAAPVVTHEAWPRIVKTIARTKRNHHAARVLRHHKKLRLARKHHEVRNDKPPVADFANVAQISRPYEY
jgi:peptidoglycan/xylan/chitin deacetylase (PgdA/CDA1 family)